MCMKRVITLLKFSLLACLATSIGVALAGCAALASNSPTPTPLPQVVSTEQTTFTVTKGPITAERDIQGEVIPTHQDQLFFRATGSVDQVNFKDGDTFKKGDVIAELQIDDLLSQLQQAQIDLKVSQDNLAVDKLQRADNVQQAQSDAVIAQKQVDLATITLNSASDTDIQIAQINLDIANEKLKTAQSYLALVQGQVNSDLEQVVQKNQVAVDRLQSQISDRQLIAPYDGILLHIAVSPGQNANAYDDTVALVGDPSQLIIQIPYDNQLVTTLNVNTEAYLYINPDKNPMYPIKYIPDFLPITSNKQGYSTSSSGLITVNYLYFAMPETIPADQAPVGSRVNLLVILGKKQDALLLPPPAIRGNDAFKYVIVLEDGYHRRVEVVSLGIQTTTEWEVIANNLKEGDVVLGPSQ